MAHHETASASLSVEEKNERFRLMSLGEAAGLSIGERASLLEHYYDQEWRDPEAIGFYDGVFAGLKQHPGEFIAAITRYEHGTGIEVLLTSTDDDPIKPHTIGGVVLNSPDTIDISDRLPRWKQFSYGLEFFAPTGSSPSDIAYRTPDLDLTDIRLTRGHGTNEPLGIGLAIGNQAIADSVDSLIDQGQITEDNGRDLLLGAALLAEVHDTNPIIIPRLSRRAQDSGEYYKGILEILQRQAHLGNLAIAQITEVHAVHAAEALQLNDQYEAMPRENYSPGMHVAQSQYPYKRIAWFDSSLANLSESLGRFKQQALELEAAMIPKAKICMQAIERYQTAAQTPRA